jgi:hypothetical protein
MFQLIKDLAVSTFDNGFRIIKTQDEDDKHWILDETDIQIGDIYEVGPNGYFELVQRRNEIS